MTVEWVWKAAKEGNAQQLGSILCDGHEKDVHTIRWSGVTALHRACQGGDIPTIELLLKHGADINARSTWGWYSPLHVACRYGHEDAILYLLTQGANWYQKDKYKLTPFKYAIRAGYASMAHRIDESVMRSTSSQQVNGINN